MVQNSFRPGLLGKMVGALALVGLLPLILISVRLIDLNRVALTDQVLSAHALAARSCAEAVHTYLQLGRNLASSAANNPVIYADPGAPEAQQLQAELLHMGGSNIVAVASFDSEQQLIMRAQRRGTGELATKLLPQGIQNRAVLFLSEDIPYLVISQVFPDGGDLRLLMHAEPLRQYLNPAELGDQAVMALVAEDKILSAGEVTVPKTMQERVSNQQVSGSGKFLTESGDLVLGAHAPLAQEPWTVVSWQPVAVAEAISHNMREQALLSVALALVLAAILAALAWRGVVRPIRMLLRRSGTTGGGDEIAQLQEAFSALERHVEDAAELQEVFLGRYKVLEKVGEGGMGMVFHGWDPKLKRPVALKTIHMDFSTTKQERLNLVADLVDEATAAANINHSNVVNVYDATDVDDMAFVAMEFVDGPSLAAYVKTIGPVPPELATALLYHVTQGLQAAHNKGIVHRDIKPANILLGRDHSVKIADFGISQFLNAASGDDKIFGTPGFLPPETLYGSTFNTQADLFALGATMFYVLTARQAFPGNNVSQIVANTIQLEPDIPPELDSSIPQALRDIVMRLLAKDPKERYASTESVLRDVANLGALPMWEIADAFALKDNEEESHVETLDAQFLETIDLGAEPGT